jgi:hypothetical protein
LEHHKNLKTRFRTDHACLQKPSPSRETVTFMGRDTNDKIRKDDFEFVFYSNLLQRGGVGEGGPPKRSSADAEILDLKVHKHEIISNFFLPKSNSYMPFVNFRKKFAF